MNQWDVLFLHCWILLNNTWLLMKGLQIWRCGNVGMKNILMVWPSSPSIKRIPKKSSHRLKCLMSPSMLGRGWRRRILILIVWNLWRGGRNLMVNYWSRGILRKILWFTILIHHGGRKMRGWTRRAFLKFHNIVNEELMCLSIQESISFDTIGVTKKYVWSKLRL